MQNGSGGGDELWDEFVREFDKKNAIHEPSAAERARNAVPLRRPRWRRGATVLAVVLIAGAVGLAAYGFGLLADGGAAEPAASASASVSTSASASASALQTGPPAVARLFPARLAGYERVATASGPDCLKDETVGPELEAMIKQSKGCLGVDLALYKDDAGDQFDLAVFDFKDPVDAVGVVTGLTAAYDDYEVAVQAPPKGSGLKLLPADSGLVQSFASYRGYVLVGMAQWADGRTADYQALEDRLSPLVDAESKLLQDN